MIEQQLSVLVISNKIQNGGYAGEEGYKAAY